MKNLSILGSTGSIGTQALEIVSLHPDRFCVQVLTAHSNLKLLYEQACQFHPRVVVLADESQRKTAVGLNWPQGVELRFGYPQVTEAARCAESDIVLNALVGFAGLVPSLAAIESSKVLALANKETLVAAGKLVTSLAEKRNIRIIPVDSEHSAIYQCLRGTSDRAALRKILLTASGGPFRGRTKAEMKEVTLAQCLKHPNWTMGRKITIDSATMMNKGLEIIEAHWLFDVSYDHIQVVVHPQSIVHSMVEFVDGSVLGQMGLPDMRLPIQFAMGLEERIPSDFPALDFSNAMSLSFDPPDVLNFPAVRLAFEAGKLGKTYACVFNAANEEAVTAFIAGRIPFLGIAETVEVVLDIHKPLDGNRLEDYAEADAWARAEVIRHIRKGG
jgi:1-deoxy-D-xylulose-5-phosphate reductoisomerase